MESKEVKSPRAFTSSSVPNSSSTSAMSVALAIESHSAVFEVFAFARVPLVNAGNTVEKHFIRLLRTSSIRVLRGPSDLSRASCSIACLHLVTATASHHRQKGMHTMHSRSRASDEAPHRGPCTSMDKPDNPVN